MRKMLRSGQRKKLNKKIIGFLAPKKYRKDNIFRKIENHRIAIIFFLIIKNIAKPIKAITNIIK